MLRAILGPSVKNKEIYQTLQSFDSDGNKQISIIEFYCMVYEKWAIELDSIDQNVRVLDPENKDDRPALRKLLKEKADVELAIQRNFNTEILRYIERLKASRRGGILQNMWTASRNVDKSKAQFSNTYTDYNTTNTNNSNGNNGRNQFSGDNLTSPMAKRMTSTAPAGFMQPTSPSPSPPPRRIKYQSFGLQASLPRIMQDKVRLSINIPPPSPSRTININEGFQMSGEAVENVLARQRQNL